MKRYVRVPAQFYFLILVVFSSSAALRAEDIWIEGEHPKTSTFLKHGWYDDVAKEGLSGHEWLSHYGDKPGTAEYEFTAAEEGPHVWWLRCNYFQSEMDYKLNDGAWTPIDLAEKNLRDGLMISKSPDHRFIGWIKVGSVALKKGANTLAVKIHSKLSNHGGIDCMDFSTSGFLPAGATKPGAGDGAETVDPDSIWVEGEHPKYTDFKKHGWYDAVNKEGLSGHEWLSHYDQTLPGIARYEFEVKKAKEYVFWLRCNYFACEMSFQMTGVTKPGGWKEIDFSEKNVRDGLMISKTPDHRFIGWVKVGTFALEAGAHEITFKIHSKLSNHGGIDCFAFTGSDFIPAGASKPVVAEAVSGPDTWFRVVADDDAFSPDSVIDLSGMLKKPAGQFGFLKAAGKDLKFEHGDAPVKFWGVNASAEAKNSDEDMRRRVRYFAKYGIDMIRQHPVESVLGPLKNGTIDAQKFAQFDRWFAELKAQGVYMTWSVFYPHRIGADEGYPAELLAELEKGSDGYYSTSGLVNMSRPLQDLELKYLKVLLNHVNPQTKLAYKDDPALAVLEIHNEDNIFFHNPLSGLAGNKPPKHAQLLRKMFAEWAKKKYGNDEALRKAWGTDETLAAGELRLFGAWEFTEKGNYSRPRMGDFLHFLTDMQREYFARRVKELREEIGYKAVIVTTGWWTGGPLAEPANLYCDAAAEMIDRHNYFGGGEGGHSIRVGKVNNETHLSAPGSGILSSGFFQTENQPFCMTEWTSVPPNQWKAEMAPLFAFYGMGLQGWDASYHFAANGPRIGDGWPGLSSYCTDTPHYIGQFPALSLAVHKNHIKEGPLAAARRIKVDELFTGKDPFQSGSTAGATPDFKAMEGTQTPNAVLAIGRVTAAFDGGTPEHADWRSYWNIEKKTVRSMTGELNWDYGRRVVTLDAPKSAAVVGFAEGGEYDLAAAKISVKSPFCSLIFTALDDLPLVESKSILITAMARDKQTHSEYSADGKQLLAIGAPPLLMEPVQAGIVLKGAPLKEIRTLDIYGVPTAVSVRHEGNSFGIDGTYKTYYYRVTR